MHIADLLEPLGRGMMRSVRGSRDVVDEPRFAGSDLLELLDVLDRLVGHRRLQVPARIALEGVDGRRVAEQVRLPLAGVATDEAVEIVEAHSAWPLIERSRLARLIKGRVVVLAEPCRCVAILFQDCSDSALLDWYDGIVTWEAGCYFADHPKAYRVMVASRDNGCPRG